MAIYQFKLTAIPRKSVLEKYGALPSKLVLDYEEWKEYYRKKDGQIKDEEAFLDAFTQDWWSSVEINIAEVVAHIDSKVKRADWGRDEFSFHWKTYTKEVDNDAGLILTGETRKIEELSFRADLREKGLTFLTGMISLAAQYDWLLMDVKGNLVQPAIEDVMGLIQQSNAFRFVSNQIKFFTDLENGTIQIE